MAWHEIAFNPENPSFRALNALHRETCVGLFRASWWRALCLSPGLSVNGKPMSKILIRSLAAAILLSAGSISYHYLYTVPKQQEFARCVQTYPAEVVESLSKDFLTSPAALCARGYSLDGFKQMLKEQGIRMVFDKYKE